MSHYTRYTDTYAHLALKHRHFPLPSIAAKTKAIVKEQTIKWGIGNFRDVICSHEAQTGKGQTWRPSRASQPETSLKPARLGFPVTASTHTEVVEGQGHCSVQNGEILSALAMLPSSWRPVGLGSITVLLITKWPSLSPTFFFQSTISCIMLRLCVCLCYKGDLIRKKVKPTASLVQSTTRAEASRYSPHRHPCSILATEVYLALSGKASSSFAGRGAKQIQDKKL